MVERIVELARERAWIFIGVAQIGPADVVHEEQVAGEDGDWLAAFVDKKRQAVRRMSRRFN